MPESRAVVSRLQRQMMALLPHYCITDLQQHQHRLRLAATAASAASDQCAAALAAGDVDDAVAQMEMSIYDILSNIVSLCSSLVTKSGKDLIYLYKPRGVPRCVFMCICLWGCLRVIWRVSTGFIMTVMPGL